MADEEAAANYFSGSAVTATQHQQPSKRQAHHDQNSLNCHPPPVQHNTDDDIMADVSMVDPQVQLFDDAPTANEVDIQEEEDDDDAEEGEDGGATEALHHHHHQHNHSSSRSSEEEENVVDTTEDNHQVQATKQTQKHQGGGVSAEPHHHLIASKNITKQAS